MQEEETFLTLRNALAEAADFFISGMVSHADGMPLTQQQAVDILEVYQTLLSDESAPEARLYMAQRTLESDFLAILLRFITEPLRHVHEMDAQLQQPFLPLRVSVVQSLHRLIAQSNTGNEQLQHICLVAAERTHLIAALLNILKESPYEPLRISAAETLFVFVLGLGREGGAAFVRLNGSSVVLASMLSESSALVRSMCASIIREIVNSIPQSLCEPVNISALLRFISEDSCADVRVLAAEVIEQALRLAPGSLTYLLMDSRGLLAILQSKFSEDTSVEVVEACGRLLETCCEVAAAMNVQAFFASVAPIGLTRTLVLRLRAGTNSAAACARGLRFLIQYTPCQYELAWKLLQDNDTLALLLKTIVNAGHGKTSNEEDFSMFQVKCVELALTLAIIMCQSPRYRDYLTNEFQQFPVWAAALKNATISFINSASLEYFTPIELQDVSGEHLNRVSGMQWTEDDKPQKDYVRDVFVAQEERIAASLAAHQSPLVYPSQVLPPSDAATEQDMRRKVRLTFILLVYVVHLTFPVDSVDAVAIGGEAGQLQAGEGGALVPVNSQSGSPHGQGASSSSMHYHPSYPGSPLSRGGAERDNEMRQLLEGKTSGSSALAKVGLSPADDAVAQVIAFDKFDSSLKLVLQLAEQYQKKKKEESMYVPSQDGYAVRVAKLKNPWKPIVKNTSLKTWSVDDIKQSDLFYFSIPFDEIDEKALRTVLTMAKRIMVITKKEIVTTPQTAKGRRWFLYDMLNNVMPRTIAILEDFLALIVEHGSSSVRFPVFLFREKEMHLGERAMHPGNLLEVFDQVKFYFSQRPADIFGMDSERIQKLAAQLEAVENNNYEFNPLNEVLPSEEAGGDDDDIFDDEDPFGAYGHGTMSSESEGDDDGDDYNSQSNHGTPKYSQRA